MLIFVFTGELVKGGNVSVTVKIGILPEINESYDLCDLVKSQLGKTCPLDPVPKDRATITAAIPDLPVRYTNLVN